MTDRPSETEQKRGTQTEKSPSYIYTIFNLGTCYNNLLAITNSKLNYYL